MNEDGCSGGEVFALRVLGHDMAPEFNDGEIIVIEPDGLLKDGARHPAGAPNGRCPTWAPCAA